MLTAPNFRLLVQRLFDISWGLHYLLSKRAPQGDSRVGVKLPEYKDGKNKPLL